MCLSVSSLSPLHFVSSRSWYFTTLSHTNFLSVRSKKPSPLVSRTSKNVPSLLPIPLFTLPPLSIPFHVLPVHPIALNTIAINALSDYSLFVPPNLFITLLRRGDFLAIPMLTVSLRVRVRLSLSLLMLRRGRFLLAANRRFLLTPQDGFNSALAGRRNLTGVAMCMCMLLGCG